MHRTAFMKRGDTNKRLKQHPQDAQKIGRTTAEKIAAAKRKIPKSTAVTITRGVNGVR